MGRRLRYQQDNAPSHKAKRVLAELKNQKIETINHPPFSPDLAPIENVYIILIYIKKAWNVLKERVRLRQPHANISDLWKVTKEEWDLLPQSFFNNLVQSIPRRAEMVLAAHGGPTKY